MDLTTDQEDQEDEVKDAEVVDGDNGGGALEVSEPEPENTLLEPASDATEVAALYDQFQEMKGEILTSEDMQSIGSGQFVTKSGWRKIATAFNLSVETVMEERTVENGVVTHTVKARAVAPNGKTATGIGKCASNESNHMESLGESVEEAQQEFEGKWDYMYEQDDILLVDGKYRLLLDPRQVNEHDVYATAATRAKNRAISDCVGGGEVSAEEVSKDNVL